MKKPHLFHLFYGIDHDAGGAIEDYTGSYASLIEAHDQFTQRRDNPAIKLDWAQILHADPATGSLDLVWEYPVPELQCERWPARAVKK